MKVGVIGGGPVGTTTGILLKKQCPEIEVHVFEQRPKFTRSQILLLDQNTWKLFPDTLRDILKPEGCFVQRPPVDTTARCYREPSGSGKRSLLFSIRISILEQALWNYAKHLGVKMHRPRKEKREITISDPRLKDFDILIGAGGKRDILRKYLNIPVHETPVSTAVILTWEPSENVSYKSRSSSGVDRRRSSQDRYRMFRSPATNYYATIQLTPKEARLMEKQGQVNQLSDIRDESILKAFENLFKYYNLRDLPEDGNIMTVPITLYYAPSSVGVARLPRAKSDTLMFLVGDAVNGVHFFSGTGVNTGIKMASTVADAICHMQRGKWTVKKAVSHVKKHIGEYIDQAREKSTDVILNSDALGECSKKTVKELRKIAIQKNYAGIHNLSKNDMCLVMGDEFVE